MPVLLVMKYFGIFPPHSFLYRVSVVSRNVPTETFSQKSSPVCLISKKLLEVSFEHASLYPCERIILITDKHLRWYNLRKKWTLLELSKKNHCYFVSKNYNFYSSLFKISFLFPYLPSYLFSKAQFRRRPSYSGGSKPCYPQTFSASHESF